MTNAQATDRKVSTRSGGTLAVLASAQFLVVLNASSVNLAVPAISSDLGLSPALSVWVVSGYLLAFGGLLLFGGRLGDVVGRRRLLVIAAAIFGLAALAGGLAPSGAVLIITRAIQGAAAAALAPAALSLLTTTFTDPAGRRRALGVWGAVASSGGAAGVLAGGGLTALWGWRAVLLLNVPIVIALLVLIPILVPKSSAVRGARLNVPGALLSFFSISATIAGLTLAGSVGWLSPITLVLIIGGLAVLSIFLITERRSSDPLIPFHLLTRWPSVGGYIGMASIAFALYPTMLISSIVLQTMLQFSALSAGLMMLPLSIATIFGSLVSPRLVGRFGLVRPLLLGLAIVVIALTALAITIIAGVPIVPLLASLIVFGVGVGVTVTSTTTLALSGADPKEAGSASGLLQTAQQLGGAIGLTVVTTIAASVAARLDQNSIHPGSSGYATGLGIAAVVALVGAIVVARRARSTQ